MARVITNDEIYSVLGSIDSSMQKSLTLMKDSLAIDERRAALTKEATERARTSDKLSSLEDDGYKASFKIFLSSEPTNPDPPVTIIFFNLNFFYFHKF